MDNYSVNFPRVGMSGPLQLQSGISPGQQGTFIYEGDHGIHAERRSDGTLVITHVVIEGQFSPVEINGEIFLVFVWIDHFGRQHGGLAYEDPSFVGPMPPLFLLPGDPAPWGSTPGNATFTG